MKPTPLRVCHLDLRDLLPSAQFFGAGEVQVSSCSADSRVVRPGDIFVALVGSEHDGHDHVTEAIRRGAAAIVAERIVPSGDIPLCVVENSRVAHGEICQHLTGNPSRRLNLVGVTGTNGKTSTSHLIRSIFSAAGIHNGLMGSLAYCDGQSAVPPPTATPSAPALADYLARMRANGCMHGVMEVSSLALAQSRMSGIEFDAACVTNVRRDHLDLHGSLKNYQNAKARIFDQLRAGGFSVLNADDPVCRQFLDRLDGPALSVGMKHPAEITASLVERLPSEQTFLLECGNEAYPVRTRMIGDHHIYNCLIATGIGLGYGIDVPTIIRGLESMDDLPGCMQRIECGQPFRAFVDYAHTPDALRAVLMTLREVTPGRLICVFGAGGDRDRMKRPLLGRQVTTFADLAIVTDDNPRDEQSEHIAQQIVGGMDETIEYLVEPNREAAIDNALSVAREGDCVLVAGKGSQDYQQFGQRRIWFDDAEVVRGKLYERYAPVVSLPMAAERRAA